MSHMNIAKIRHSSGSTAREGARLGASHGPVSDTCIVFASDDNYGMPLATAIRSIAENDTNLERVPVYVLSSGITDQTRRKVEASVAAFDVRLHWLQIDLTPFSAFGTLHYASKTTFARLRIPEVLPSRIRRVLYLDADVLVLRSLQELLYTDLKGAVLGAVLDGMESRREAGFELLNGVPAVEAYFNAGSRPLFQRERSNSSSKIQPPPMRTRMPSMLRSMAAGPNSKRGGTSSDQETSRSRVGILPSDQQFFIL
jgi:hypothetical protein